MTLNEKFSADVQTPSCTCKCSKRKKTICKRKHEARRTEYLKREGKHPHLLRLSSQPLLDTPDTVLHQSVDDGAYFGQTQGLEDALPIDTYGLSPVSSLACNEKV